MSEIERTFESLRAAKDGAFIGYVCAGDPDVDFTVDQVIRLSDAGADIIELGHPFSDPVADGPVIQAAMKRSLDHGFRTRDLFNCIRSIREAGVRKPVVAMTYYNPVFQSGPADYCKELASAGADGLLVVDLPPEESGEIDSHARGCGLDLIRLVTPTTNDLRMAMILSGASGFVYVVSAAGTTGARAKLPPSAPPLLKRTKAMTRLPVALGFGISTPAQVAAALSLGASGVVEGSGLIAAYSNLLSDRSIALDSVGDHARQMKQATVGALVDAPSAQL